MTFSLLLIRNKGETDFVPVGCKNVAAPGYTVFPKVPDVGNPAKLASTPLPLTAAVPWGGAAVNIPLPDTAGGACDPLTAVAIGPADVATAEVATADVAEATTEDCPWADTMYYIPVNKCI